MAREVWDVRLSTSAGDRVLPAPEMNRVISLPATAYSLAIFAISRLEGSAGCGSSAILRLASCAGCPIGQPVAAIEAKGASTVRGARLAASEPDYARQVLLQQ
jgi:hypothetical protein